MNHTTNYNLSQWEKSDRVLMEDFNSDNAKIDGALAEHTAALAKKGNVRVAVHTYTGTGKYGSGNPCHISFTQGEPLLILVMGTNSNDLWLHRGLTQTNNYSNYCQVNWQSSGVSWYSYKDAEDQLNVQGWSYTALIFYKLG